MSPFGGSLFVLLLPRHVLPVFLQQGVQTIVGQHRVGVGTREVEALAGKGGILARGISHRLEQGVAIGLGRRGKGSCEMGWGRGRGWGGEVTVPIAEV